MLQFTSTLLMFIYASTKNKFVGFISWTTFGVFWLLNLPYYLSISDYFNSALMVAAFSLFTLLGLTILRANDDVFPRLTFIAAISSLIYFTFAETMLGKELIKIVATQTSILASFLGYEFTVKEDLIYYNDKIVQIILACTGIESISLFAGISLGAEGRVVNKLKAFLVSVPVIYMLNLLRNTFIILAYGDSWFGENSFYIAHHVISKLLATVALIIIAMQVFKYLPNFAEDIFKAKDAVVRTWLEKRR